MNFKRLKIDPINRQIYSRIEESWAQKTKPVKSLGRLEEIGCKLGAIQRSVKPKVYPATALIFASDHGVSSRGVSRYPREVTAQMTLNFLAGGAAINVIADTNEIDLKIVDMGVDYDFDKKQDLVHAKIRKGTTDFTVDKAMSEEEAQLSLDRGYEIAKATVEEGAKCLLIGEMGIGNSTSASAIFSAISGFTPEVTTGSGSGVKGKALNRKITLIRKSLDLHRPDPKNPIQILSCVGGFEIGAMAGAILYAASNQIPVLIDGFIAGSAVLLASLFSENSLQYCLFSHLSGEKGHRPLLDYLKAKPLLDLGMRLGEGSGAAIAYPILFNSCNLLEDMATFSSAGVSDS